MTRAESYRQLVVARAGGACEYCRLLEAATGVTFHVEHVVPRSQGGETVMSNLVAGIRAHPCVNQSPIAYHENPHILSVNGDWSPSRFEKRASTTN